MPKYLPCVSCGKRQKVEGAVERVWCVDCNRSDRLNNAADAIAELLGVSPEHVMIEPSLSRLSLTLNQAERLVALAAKASSEA